ncbi:hypothetical protein IGS59_04330 [Janthinobacterium sp. GW460P]|uniref:hypothetical protein n=1 Tax=unclassified Janthinobacterium TaxID=2610881 RepID=UPI00111C7914|nr:MULTISPECIES: hypothetical protein [unclassified Janthinobacterium]MCC7701456.1 hypothetical protein [Janthinobacterium sp. GW460P]MCC7706963.1 hypothetical protein [Janthinobacterium sp. GW460W]
MNTAPPLGLRELEQLIMKHVPRDIFMACEDAYYNGDEKGRTESSPFAKGHRPSAAGQIKHFRINEAFHEALEAQNADPTPIKGTQLVIGRSGIFKIVRLNVPGHKWVNLRRSATRKALAELNDDIKRSYVQSDFFTDALAPAGGTIFIIGVMDGIDEKGISQLTQVKIALPAPDMKSWLYINTISDFVSLYDQANVVTQVDNAQPKLKKNTKKQTGNDQGN